MSLFYAFLRAVNTLGDAKCFLNVMHVGFELNVQCSVAK
jgi:hypothetical protein